jgi:molybdate transport system substrate-binding protein
LFIKKLIKFFGVFALVLLTVITIISCTQKVETTTETTVAITTETTSAETLVTTTTAETTTAETTTAETTAAITTETTTAETTAAATESSETTATTISEKDKTEIIVSAAASLTEAMIEIQKQYATVKPEVKVKINFGASGALQQQIENGAPVDLFISAGKKQMDALVKKNLIVNDTNVYLLGNELVLIVGKDDNDVKTVEDLEKDEVQHIAIGYPDSVPAGMYAWQSLVNLGLWDTLGDKYVFAKDVKSVLSYVEIGNADAGFVYTTDALASSKVKVVVTLPSDSHEWIVYPAAVISASKHIKEATDFLNYIKSDAGMKTFIKYGFKDMRNS